MYLLVVFYIVILVCPVANIKILKSVHIHVIIVVGLRKGTQARVQEFVRGGGAKSESIFFFAFQFFRGSPAQK